MLKHVTSLILVGVLLAGCENNPTETASKQPAGPGSMESQASAQSSAGVLLATTNLGSLVEIDIDAGTTRFIGDVNTPTSWSGLSFDSEGNLYVSSPSNFEPREARCSGGVFGTGGCAHLYRLDRETGGVLQHIGSTGVTFVSDIDYSPGGTLFGNFYVNERPSGDGALATIDPASAAATLVGRFGSGDGFRDLDNGALSVHPVTGEIWAIEANFSDEPSIFRVDPATGRATGPPVRVGFGGFPVGFGFDALEILPDGRFIATRGGRAIFGGNQVYLIDPVPDPSSGLAEITRIPLPFAGWQGALNGLESAPGAAANQPPVADAGDDLTAECTSPAGAAVTMDGSGSSDPDGNALSFSWSAAGIGFDDPPSPTPTATFPLGLTEVTVAVEDAGGLTDTDVVEVRVEDTTAPSVTLHMAIVNHFRGKGGVDDAVFRILEPIVADDCDPNVSGAAVGLTLNGQPLSPGDLVRLRLRHRVGVKGSDEFALRMEAPSFILETTVTDASGNSTMAQAAVTLELFANAELDEDEVVPGTGEPGLGVPVDDDAAEDLAEYLEELHEEGYHNPAGVPSAAVHALP